MHSYNGTKEQLQATEKCLYVESYLRKLYIIILTLTTQTVAHCEEADSVLITSSNTPVSGNGSFYGVHMDRYTWWLTVWS
jgi:hypothetical protein